MDVQKGPPAGGHVLRALYSFHGSDRHQKWRVSSSVPNSSARRIPVASGPLAARAKPETAATSTSQATSGSSQEARTVKKLEHSFVAGVTRQPSLDLWLVYKAPPPPYAPLVEGRTGGGGKAYGLEDIARIHDRDGRSGMTIAQ
jgi:hypothetical protein